MEALLNGLSIALEWQHLLAMAIGVVAGVLLGALPGLTAALGISLLIPLTFGMSPMTALGMMAGIHNGGSYGGAIPAVLLRIPGSPGAIATTFDGHPMALQGRARPALSIAVVSSAIGGMGSALALLILAPPLAQVALAFGPPEIFWVNLFGLASIAVLLGTDPLKGLLAACLGLALGTVGIDQVSGYERFTFDRLELSGGLPLLVVLVGLYALPPAWQMAVDAIDARVESDTPRLERAGRTLWPWRDLLPTWLRGSLIGIAVGILPGVGGTASSFIAYNEAKRTSRDPDSFGQGNPIGVAAAECANNADNAASMIPALTLGVPGSGLAALMLGGLLVHGLQPGPALFERAPDVVYGYMWSMFITSAMLLVLGGPVATRLFAHVLHLPRVLLMPLIVALTVVGAYTFRNNMFDVYVMLGFGCLGYLLERLAFPAAPLILGLILGPPTEFNLRVSLLLAQGDPSIFWTRPISQGLMVLVGLVLLSPLYPAYKTRRATRRRG